jgi:hypothetical protein
MLGTSEQEVYGNAFRIKRMNAFLILVDVVLANSPVCRILDIGGWKSHWLALEHVWGNRNLKITLVNLEEKSEHTEGRYTYVSGDARDLKQFPDNSFDIVHSNSVIEHVGTWFDKQRMANEVRRLAPLYFVQTPNYWFPFEPHLRMPIFHWLPQPLQRRIVMSRACGFHPRASSVEQAEIILSDAALIDAPAMAALFPDARIDRELFGPLTKSLVAVRDNSGTRL